MIKYNTYKELIDNRYNLEKKLKNNTITKDELYDLKEIHSVINELKIIKKEKTDRFWQTIISTMMSGKKNTPYKIVKTERQVMAYRASKEIPTTLKYTLILPQEYNVNSIPTNELIDCGEHARNFFEKGIVLYIDNSTFIGLPLDIINYMDELAYSIYKKQDAEKTMIL